MRAWIVPLLLCGCLYGCGRADDALLTRAEDAIRAKLPDPDSAVFTDEMVKKLLDFGSPEGLEANVCGSVNYKDRLGQFVGLHAFLVTMHGTRNGVVEIYPGDIPARRTMCTWQ